MARITVLPLPESLDDPYPFALIVDQADGMDEDAVQRFAHACGARAVLITQASVDVRS